MANNLRQIRENLAELNEFVLAERFQSASSDAEVDKGIASRYEKARNEYLRRRIQQVFYQHLESFDGTKKTMPEVPTEEERKELEKERQEIQARLKDSMLGVHGKFQEMKSKYALLCSRREELATMLKEAETTYEEQDSTLDGSVTLPLDNKENVTEEDLIEQNNKLNQLSEKRAQLESELARLEAQTTIEKERARETEDKLIELRARRKAAKPSAGESIEDVERETEQLRSKVEKLEGISEWYGGALLLMERLTSIKVLNADHLPDENNDMKFTLRLLEKHDMYVRLTPNTKNGKYRVAAAGFRERQVIEKSTAEGDSCVKIQVPHLKDLVKLCSDMEPGEGIRFLVQETTTRIRAMTSRADDLAHLRTKFLTKICDLHHSEESFGGEDQEVVCSLEEGVTVVLRLTPDCPLRKGSVYIDQIVGVGSWDEGTLNEAKDSINSLQSKCTLEIMNALSERIKHLQKEGGISLPNTPVLPART